MHLSTDIIHPQMTSRLCHVQLQFQDPIDTQSICHHFISNITSRIDNISTSHESKHALIESSIEEPLNMSCHDPSQCAK